MRVPKLLPPFSTAAWLRLPPMLRPLALPLIVLVACFLVTLFAVTATEGIVRDRMVGIAVIVGLMTLAWIDRSAWHHVIERNWSVLARRTGLECRTRGWLFGFDVQVAGLYRGRRLNLSVPRQGKGQVAGTRVALRVANRHNARFRMRGPFDRSDDYPDRVSADLLQSIRAEQFGVGRKFFVHGETTRLSRSLREHPELLDRLLELQVLTNIELAENNLIFDQLGVLRDEAELERIFALLSDLADQIEAWPARIVRR